MSKSTSNRRWFQFRLRTLLAVVTLWGLVLPFVPSLIAKYKARRDDDEWIDKGGSGTIEPFASGGCYFGPDVTLGKKLPARSPHTIGTLNKTHLRRAH
jgi:hypothetical protein